MLGAQLEHIPTTAAGQQLSPGKAVSKAPPNGFHPWLQFPGLLAALKEEVEGRPGPAALKQEVEGRPGSATPHFLPVNEDSAYDKAAVESRLHERVLAPVNELAAELGLRLKYRARGRHIERETDARCDFYIVWADMDTTPVACGQLKSPRQCLLPYNRETRLEATAGESSELEPVCNQLYGEMVVGQFSLGVLTNFNITVFFSRLEFEDGFLYVSDPFDSMSGDMLWGYLLLLKLAEVREDERRANVSKWHLPQAEVEAIRKLNEVNDLRTLGLAVARAAAASGSGRVPGQRGSVSSTGSLGIPEFGRRLVAHGGSAAVLFGMIEGRAAAVKVFKRRCSEKEGVVREVTAYEALGLLQGRSIPSFLACGFLEGSLKHFLAMTLEGPPLSSIEISPAIAASATRALQQIHLQGFVHGDIRLSNFVLGCSEGAEDVMAIDLARSEADDSWEGEARVEETEELQRLLVEKLRSTADLGVAGAPP